MTATGSGPPNESLRQTVHVAFGLVAVSLRWLPPSGAVLLLAAALAHNLFLIPRYARSLWRSEDEVRGFSVGIATYPAVLLAAVAVFHDRLHLAAAVWALLAFGDGAATLAGRAVRGASLPWNARKTWVGSAAYAVVGAAAAAGLAAFVSLRADQGPPISLAAALVPCAVVALVAAFVESLPSKLDDNVTTSVTAAALLAAWAAVVPAELAEAKPVLLARLPVALAAGAALAALAFGIGALDLPGAATGCGLAAWILVWGGVPGLSVLAAFVVLGVGATRFGARDKEARGVAQPGGGRRGWSHALANGGVAAGLSFLSVSTGRPDVFRLAFTGALATAAFDTVASEIGKVRGLRAVTLPGRRAVPPGTTGAVSREGTLAGLAAAIVVAAVGAASGLCGVRGALLVVAAASVGGLAESVAGAWLDRRAAFDPGALNVLNTAVGAAICLGFGGLVEG